MSYFNAGLSHISSSSSNLEDELDLTPTTEAQIQAIYVQQATLLNACNNNNRIMAYHLNEEENNKPSHRGSVPGRRCIYRNREDVERNLWVDYFTENPRCNESMFRRQFRMSRSLFIHIVDAVKGHDNYFKEEVDHPMALVSIYVVMGEVEIIL